MLLTLALTVLLSGFWHCIPVLSKPEINTNENVNPSINNNSQTSDDAPKNRCHDPSVAAFSAAFYTALLKSNDAGTIFKELPSDESADTHHQVLDKIAGGDGLCNAHSMAYVESAGMSLLPVFTIARYFEVVGFSVGEYLKQQHILNCDNAVSLANTYADLIDGILGVLDKSRLDSYFIAVTEASKEFVTVNLNLIFTPKSGHDMSFFFYEEYAHKAGIVL